MTDIGHLPEDILEEIFRHLPVHDIGLSICLVNKRWRDAALSDSLWHVLFLRDRVCKIDYVPKHRWMQAYHENLLVLTWDPTYVCSPKYGNLFEYSNKNRTVRKATEDRIIVSAISQEALTGGGRFCVLLRVDDVSGAPHGPRIAGDMDIGVVADPSELSACWMRACQPATYLSQRALEPRGHVEILLDKDAGLCALSSYTRTGARSTCDRHHSPLLRRDTLRLAVAIRSTRYAVTVVRTQRYWPWEPVFKRSNTVYYGCGADDDSAEWDYDNGNEPLEAFRL